MVASTTETAPPVTWRHVDELLAGFRATLRYRHRSYRE